ncbi:MAG: tetratricopeptide repeat protein [Alphaproteobacteria bacterium]|nr:tetratricopeptide repeat protein [Alphaproteobacteria bacterium]
MTGSPDEKIVDVTPFKKAHVRNTKVRLGAIVYGLKHNMWHKEKIPPGLVKDLQEAYPENFPPVPLERLGDNEHALERHDEALVAKPGDPVLLGSKGRLLARMGRHEDAISCFDGVLRVDPGLHRTRIDKSRSLAKLERYEDALDCLDVVLGMLEDGITSSEHTEHQRVISKLERGGATILPVRRL